MRRVLLPALWRLGAASVIGFGGVAYGGGSTDFEDLPERHLVVPAGFGDDSHGGAVDLDYLLPAELGPHQPGGQDLVVGGQRLRGGRDCCALETGQVCL